MGIDPDLESLGVLAMLDGRSTEFVGVFRGSGRGARVQDPAHVAELIWMGPDEADRPVAADPDQFTPTVHASKRSVPGHADARQRIGTSWSILAGGSEREGESLRHTCGFVLRARPHPFPMGP